MLCRLLTISSSSSSPSPLRSSALLGHSDRSQVAAEEPSMETLGLRPEEAEAAEEHVAWAEFSVDELLDFESVENGKEDDDIDEIEEQKEVEESNSSSSSYYSSSSAVDCFEPPLGLHGIGLPAHDAEEFEWVSLIMDDSLSEFPSPPPVAAAAAAQSGEDAGSRSPTFASPAVCILSTEAMVPVKAKRSKRSRSTAASAAAAWSMSGPRLFPDSASDSTVTSPSSSMSSCSSPSMSSYLIHHLPPPTAGQSFLLSSDGPPLVEKQKKKKRGRKPKPPAHAAAPAPGERRCAHCGSQKTPQWRAGPLGAKTLCNACGVRFKSGRLLPEYRPACSPTFVGHIHSNCHRKVLEMRRNKEAQLSSSPAPAPPVQSF